MNRLIQRLKSLLFPSKTEQQAYFPVSRQREEGDDEVLVFVIDESYPNPGKFINMEKYEHEIDWNEAASAVFLKQIETEFGAEFEDANIGPGAEVPAFVTAIGSNIILLLPWLIAIFFSGKPMIENLDAW